MTKVVKCHKCGENVFNVNIDGRIVKFICINCGCPNIHKIKNTDIPHNRKHRLIFYKQKSRYGKNYEKV